ncbi:unnamed protein product [Pleuronectes platessa]|uniref:Uncharacterized protein n=1 Tax=Pleuronectes platessa TaxID=8262 RepID=A0A9N7VEF4_PLEPL|nr:unnamed protein product [Pleuronectes platessa]
MGNVIAFSLRFFIWGRESNQREDRRERVRDPASLLVSRWNLLQSAVLISGAATAILSYCRLAATPQPIDGGLGRPSPALSHLPLESGRLSGSYPKMNDPVSELRRGPGERLQFG